MQTFVFENIQNQVFDRQTGQPVSVNLAVSFRQPKITIRVTHANGQTLNHTFLCSDLAVGNGVTVPKQYCWIQNLCSDNHHFKGLGTLLVKSLIQLFLNSHLSLPISLVPFGNGGFHMELAPIIFYHKLGFRPVGINRNEALKHFQIYEEKGYYDGPDDTEMILDEESLQKHIEALRINPILPLTNEHRKILDLS